VLRISPTLQIVLLALPLVQLACGGDDDDDDASPPSHAIEGLLGEGGVALFVDPPPTGSLTIEATAEDGAIYSVSLAGGDVAIDDRGASGTTYALLDGDEELARCAPIEPVASVAADPDPAVLLAGESLTLQLEIDGAGLTLATADLVVRRRLLPAGGTTYLDPACLDEEVLDDSCWLVSPTPLQTNAAVADLEPLVLPPHAPVTDGPHVEEIGPWLHVLADDGAELFAGEARRVVFLGTSLVWGDPHAHSNLSHDGCEDAETCRNRGTTPGEDFFDNAVGAGLDFAAITEHAEWQSLQQDGDATYELWDEVLDRVEDALVYEDDGFVPLLGFEWTSFVNPLEVLEGGELALEHPEEFNRGHKTVLFHSTDVCDLYRVGAETAADLFVKVESGLVYGQEEDRPVAATTDQFGTRMAEAADACGEQEVVTFYHHPALKFPNPVNWSLAVNEPDPQVEMLVEIASEHGSFECLDPEQEGCAFWIPDDPINEYLWWGSVQHALAQGYRLGFVGGTDSHDGRPGTLDEPSTVAVPVDTDGDGLPDGIDRQMTPGALTGVWTEPGIDPRDALWEGLRARRTMATTGPQGPVAAVAMEPDGTPHVPGSVIPAGRFPVALTVVVDPGDDHEVETIEVVDPVDGAVVAAVEDAVLVTSLSAPDSPALYVRARLWQGDTEHRIWLSPFFVGQ